MMIDDRPRAARLIIDESVRRPIPMNNEETHVAKRKRGTIEMKKSDVPRVVRRIWRNLRCVGYGGVFDIRYVGYAPRSDASDMGPNPTRRIYAEIRRGGSDSISTAVDPPRMPVYMSIRLTIFISYYNPSKFNVDPSSTVGKG